MQFEEERYFTPRDARSSSKFCEDQPRFNHASKKQTGSNRFDESCLLSVAKKLNFDRTKYRDTSAVGHSQFR